MKKRVDNKRSQEMPEFSFKEFTPEEDRIYTEAVNYFRQALSDGKTLKDAYAGYPISDESLRSMIQADFMKILIAERHFGQGQPLELLAKTLGVSMQILKDTRARMLQEVGVTAANRLADESGATEPKTDD